MHELVIQRHGAKSLGERASDGGARGSGRAECPEEGGRNATCNTLRKGEQTLACDTLKWLVNEIRGGFQNGANKPYWIAKELQREKASTCTPQRQLPIIVVLHTEGTLCTTEVRYIPCEAFVHVP